MGTHETHNELAPERVDEHLVLTYYFGRDLTLHNSDTDESRVFKDAVVVAIAFYQNDTTIITATVKSSNHDDVKVAHAVSPVRVPRDALKASTDMIVYDQVIGIAPPEDDNYDTRLIQGRGLNKDNEENREFLI